MTNPATAPITATDAHRLPTRAALFFAPAVFGSARISYDRDVRSWSVWAPGTCIRSTRNFTRALDLLVGLA